MKAVRCAIYTRKSSDEGLEQNFNSLDAQREACAAYILSQASEGWAELPDLYDDGGISGGTLERPALQRLLADIAAGKIDTVVVYKVDRLSRSLFDFAKLVEAFEKANVSFVSITQSFNTTTSMGRLTLNMLLSFAQFEREVTAERIRDKIAASKAKGMWMGGVPPLGYEPDGRSLKIVEEHAVLVRMIFARFLEEGNVYKLQRALVEEGVQLPVRTLRTGREIGGCSISTGQIYKLLNCRTYIGEIDHGGKIHAALSAPIIGRDMWDQAQALLRDNLQGTRGRRQATERALLADKVVDGAGERLLSVHACKGTKRHRYYVSDRLHHGRSTDGMRIPARELETVVVERIAEAFEDPLALIAQAKAELVAADIGRVTEKARVVVAAIRAKDGGSLRPMIAEVRVTARAIDIACDRAAVAASLGVGLSEGEGGTFTLNTEVTLTRTGRAMRLVEGGRAVTVDQPEVSTIRLLAQAHRYWRELKKGHLTVGELAAQENIGASYLTRIVRLAFLSPDVVAAILAGKQRVDVNAATMIATDAIRARWTAQRSAFLTMPRSASNH
jgi:DNA invertase Pin-like site-specific DNA recombinase